MQRRAFVRAVVTIAAAPKLLLGQQANPAPPPPAPVPWTTGLNAKTPLPKTEVAEAIAETRLRFFTATQMETLERLSDVFVPPVGGKPGAIDAQTPAFLDFLVGSSPDERKKMYQDGLDWLDAEAKKRYEKSFAALETPRIDDILQPWMRTWMTDHPPTEAHADFVNIAHAEIRTATVNSKAWSEAPALHGLESTPSGLYWSPIDPDIYAQGAQRARSHQGNKAAY